MVNQEELALCKKRGHDTGVSLRHGWMQCKWCGIWLREVVKIEEVHTAEELAACKRRGHKVVSSWPTGGRPGLRLMKCEWCHISLEEVVKIEEREDEPPELEQSPYMKLESRYGETKI